MSSLERFKVCPSCGEENLPTAADCAKCHADILAERVERRVVESRVEFPESDPDENLASKPPPFVRLESFADPTKVFKVCEGQSIGRSDQSDVVLEGIPDLDSISRKMARFGRRGSSWYVQHVASTNYISVDGEEYEDDDEVTIRDGSVLGLALCQFLVRIPGEGG